MSEIKVKGKRCKMSKSRGNVVMIDEVARGVCGLSDEYQFRDLQGYLIDYRAMGVWRTPEGDYRTSTSNGGQPVFLHQFDEQIPTLIIGKQQHPEEVAFWKDLSKRYEAVHGCPLPSC
jgi:glutathione peroxidase-family protein